MRSNVIILAFFLWAASAFAGNEPVTTSPDREPSREDLEIISVMDILQLMDLMESMDMVIDMDVLIEGYPNEKQD